MEEDIFIKHDNDSEDEYNGYLTEKLVQNDLATENELSFIDFNNIEHIKVFLIKTLDRLNEKEKEIIKLKTEKRLLINNTNRLLDKLTKQ